MGPLDLVPNPRDDGMLPIEPLVVQQRYYLPQQPCASYVPSYVGVRVQGDSTMTTSVLLNNPL